MKLYFVVCLFFFVFINNISYSQNYECDNQFGDCGTPEQSGGGGGGKGSVLIANTDLGDTYQNADDFDDDGIEDGSDNCMRHSNPDQFDRDGDGIGDACDNCLSTFNPQQQNLDGDSLGDMCDDDIDGDNIVNYTDDCPSLWGEMCSNISPNVLNNNQIVNYNSPVNDTNKNKQDNIFYKESSSCNQSRSLESTIYAFFIFFISLLFVKN